MKNKSLQISASVIALIGISWLVFLHSGSPIDYPSESLDIKLLEADSLNCPNILIGVQAEMYAIHYQSSETFYERLDAHLLPYKSKILKSKNRWIVFPEHIGTWLVAADEYPSIYQSKSVTTAMIRLVLSNPLGFWKSRLSVTEARDKTQAGIFLLKAKKSASIYQDVFQRLAKEYSATIIAGSIVLPESKIIDGDIHISGTTLYNTSFVFESDGNIALESTSKVFPINSEQTFCAAGKLEDLNTISSGPYSIATLICADSWYPEAYQKIRSQNAGIIVVPSYSVGQSIMSEPWKGYNGFAPPSDVQMSDVNHITEEEAWEKYALSGRLKNSEIGLNVFLRGQLWDMYSDGRSKLVIDSKDFKTDSNGAALLIGCLP